MKSIKEATRICTEIEAMRRGGCKVVKWTDVFETEEAIIEALKRVEIPANGEPPFVGFSPLYKGYEYVHSFAKRVQAGSELTEKQMIMAKRIALEIRKAASIAG